MTRRLAPLAVLALALAACSTGPVSPTHAPPSAGASTTPPGVPAGPSSRPSATVPAGMVLAFVTSVVDGDTIHVRKVNSARITTVRILGGDTPETVKPGTPVQCYGPQASAYAHARMPVGIVVALIGDHHQPARDRFGRDLWHVRVGGPAGRLYMEDALLAGYARLVSFRTDFDPLYRAASAVAQARHAGLWSACPPRS
jgi:micrococcal nuclease